MVHLDQQPRKNHPSSGANLSVPTDHVRAWIMREKYIVSVPMHIITMRWPYYFQPHQTTDSFDCAKILYITTKLHKPTHTEVPNAETAEN